MPARPSRFLIAAGLAATGLGPLQRSRGRARDHDSGAGRCGASAGWTGEPWQ
jgi:hypothetical protein